jgi:hypothetical protein
MFNTKMYEICVGSGDDVSTVLSKNRLSYVICSKHCFVRCIKLVILLIRDTAVEKQPLLLPSDLHAHPIVFTVTDELKVGCK